MKYTHLITNKSIVRIPHCSAMEAHRPTQTTLIHKPTGGRAAHELHVHASTNTSSSRFSHRQAKRISTKEGVHELHACIFMNTPTPTPLSCGMSPERSSIASGPNCSPCWASCPPASSRTPAPQQWTSRRSEISCSNYKA